VIANCGAVMVTDADLEALPPAPVHCNVYETVPSADGTADWDPLVAMAPDQSLWLGVDEATQEVACVLDQVSVTDTPKVTEVGDAEIVTVGIAGGGTTVVPPPQVLSTLRPQKTATSSASFFIAPPHAKTSAPGSTHDGENKDRIIGSLFGRRKGGRVPKTAR
jgi:hypothetical protein